MLRITMILGAVAIALAMNARSHADSPAASGVSPPNIVMILADDLGIECLRAYGGRSHATPHIDRLVADGRRFTHCFSNPLCSPSRATLLTGRYPFRHGLKEVIWNAKRHANTFLDPQQPSFARQLQTAGYATAIAGKWQLSFLRQHDTIHDFGFDEYQCWQIVGADGERTTRFQQPYFRQNGVVIADTIRDRYGPDANVEFLTHFIQKNARAKRPFLAYYASLLPHFPWVPTPDSDGQAHEPTAAEAKGNPRYFPDMVAYLDKQVGQPGTPRKWVHFQNKEDRVVRDHHFMLTNRGDLRPVVEIWQEPSETPLSPDAPEWKHAHQRLQKVFDGLGR